MARVIDGMTFAQVGKNLTGEKDNNFQFWDLMFSDANRIVEGSYDKLVSINLTAYHEIGLVRAAVRAMTENVIGHGIYGNSQPDKRILKNVSEKTLKDFSDELEGRFSLFANKQGFFRNQSLVYQSSKIMGDSLLLLKYDQGSKEIHLVPVESLIIDSYAQDTVNGIITHKSGVLAGQHKGIALRSDAGVGEIMQRGQKSGRLNYIHFFKPERPNQLRGFPLCYSIINILKNLDRYLDAETKKAVIGSMLTYVLKSDVGTARKVVDGIQKGIFNDVTGDKETKIKDGVATRINKDEDLQMLDNTRQTQGISQYYDVVAQIASTHTGVTKEQLLRHYGASYSASQAARQDAMATYVPEQQYFSAVYCQTVVDEWLRNELITGRMKDPTGKALEDANIFIALSRHKWIAPKMKHIDPMKEVKADELKEDRGWVKPSDIVSKYSEGTDDFEAHIKKVDDQNKMRANTLVSVGEDKKDRNIESKETNTKDVKNDKITTGGKKDVRNE